MRTYLLFGLAVAALVVVVMLGMEPRHRDPSERRATSHENALPLLIGIALPSTKRNDAVARGAELAVKQINESGDTLGRKLSLTIMHTSAPPSSGATDDTDAADARDQAIRLAALRPIAVIGHDSWDGALSASQVYEERRILFLALHPTSDSLNGHDFDVIFRLSTRTRERNNALATYAAEKGFCSILAFRANAEQGNENLFYFQEYARERGIDVASAVPYPAKSTDFMETLLFFLAKSPISLKNTDAIYFSGSAASVTAFVADARSVGIKQPIIGSWSVKYNPNGHNSTITNEDIEANTLGNNRNTPARWPEFADRYRTAFGYDPNESAALGYDSVYLIARAIRETRTTESYKLATYLHALRHIAPFDGVIGPIAFELDGNLIGASVDIVEFNNDKIIATQWKTAAADLLSSSAVPCKRAVTPETALYNGVP